MAEVLVIGKKISEMSLVNEITGEEKIPTSALGDKAVTTDQLLTYVNNNGVAQWGRIGGDIANQVDLQNQFTQERDTLKSYTQDQVSQQQAALQNHIQDQGNPHNVTKEQVGLGFVDNTADVDKPVSTAVQEALSLKADQTYVDDSLANKTHNSLLGRDADGAHPASAISFRGESVDSKLSRENLSVWDFFTESEKQAYNLAILNGTSATFDSYRPLQEFFDYIAANDVNTAYCSADLYVSKGVILGGVNGSLTKNVIGRLKLSAIDGNPIDELFKIQAGQNLKWYGLINVVGIGGLIYNSRTVKRGLVLGGQYASLHTWIQAARAEGGFIEYGILVDNYTTGSCIDDVRTTRCGSGHFKSNNTGSPNWSLNSTFTIQSENTSSGATQETVLNVSTLPPDWLYYSPMVVINEKLYHVNTVDRANSRIAIRPLLDRNDLDKTSLRYMFGAGVLVAGSDASVVRIGKYNATDNSIAMHSGALYAPIITALTSEANGIGLLIGGGSTSQAHVGGSIGSFYCENNIWDIVRRTTAQLSYSIATTNYEQNFSRFTNLAALRNSTTNVLTDNDGLNGIQVGYKGFALSWESRAGGANNVTSIDVTDVNRSEYWHNGSSKTFNIAAPNINLNNVFGFNRKSCVVVGTNDKGNPTGDIVFNAPAGYTVNGLPSVTFNGFTQAAKFDVYLQWVRNNFVVACTTLPPTATPAASVTYNPDPIDAGETLTTTVTLAGAVVGDIVQAAFSRYNAGIEISAVVSAPDTVLVKFKNTSAAPIDLVSGTLKVKTL